MLTDALDINRHSMRYDTIRSVTLKQLCCAVHGDYLDRMTCNKVVSNGIFSCIVSSQDGVKSMKTVPYTMKFCKLSVPTGCE
jgi:hypothetical protein